ncbi:HAMP domain-containing protein [Nocardia panacis]|uniref:histidine kinase n=1 Tax=Nocardia panacis TaxID=2340916 RepID=A0A3A4KS76_9NOCA|nr:ATP-binding protein [Nocardia panacis]RJO78816.1 HAMP domain-containing protein [Nocardia panacis]
MRDAARSGRKRWALGNWDLRWKVTAVLAVPLAVAVGLGVSRISSEFADAGKLADASDSVSTVPAVTALSANLATVAGSQTIVIGGNSIVTDQNLADLDKAIGSAEKSLDTLGAVPAARALLDGMVTQSKAIRAQGKAPATQPQPEVVAMIDRMRGDSVRVVESVVGQVSDQTVDSAKLRLVDSLNTRATLVGELAAFSDLAQNPKVGAQTFLTAANTERVLLNVLAHRFSDTDPSIAELRSGIENRVSLMTSPQTQAGSAPIGDFKNSLTSSLAVYEKVVAKATKDIDTEMDSLVSRAQRDAWTYTAVVVVTILAALLLAVFVARSMIVPLHRLRLAALRVAESDLPQEVAQLRNGAAPEDVPLEPMPVRSTEEIGQLARAVDDIHGQALRLASDQAQMRSQVNDMFETLARRSKSLVDHQLTLIEAMEYDEKDPRLLENLFRLDHLAARMRRNGDNLLILAGTRQRRAKSAPVEIADVLRAAISEVEDYERVKLGATPRGSLVEPAASDMAHLFAELLDNALRASPPETDVKFTFAQAHDQGMLIEVADRGIGMPPSEMAEINHRLEQTAEPGPDTARHMGLFVVGRLAERHGLTVRLRPTFDTARDPGVTVTVHVPPSLIVPGKGPMIAPTQANPQAPQRPAPAAPATAMQTRAITRTPGGNVMVTVDPGVSGPVPTGGPAPTSGPIPTGASGPLPQRQPGSSMAAGLRQDAGPTLRPAPGQQGQAPNVPQRGKLAAANLPKRNLGPGGPPRPPTGGEPTILGAMPPRDPNSGELPQRQPGAKGPQAGGALPQRQPNGAPQGGLPQRQPGSNGAPGPGAPQRGANGALPQREPGSVAPQRDSASGLPQREPTGGMPPRDRTSGLPQRDALSGPMPPRENSGGALPERNGGLPQRKRDPLSGDAPRDPLSGGPAPRDSANGLPQRDPAANGLPQRDSGIPGVSRPDPLSGDLPRRDPLPKRDALSGGLPPSDKRDPLSGDLPQRDATGAPGMSRPDPLSGDLPRREPSGALPQRDTSGAPQAGGLPQRDATGGVPPRDPASGPPKRDPLGRDPLGNGLPQRDPAAGGLPQRDSAAGGLPQRDPAAGGMPLRPAANGLPQRDASGSGSHQRDPLAGGLPQRDPTPGRDALSGGAPPRDPAGSGLPQRNGGLPQRDAAGTGVPPRDALSGDLPTRDSANGLPQRDSAAGSSPRDALSGGVPPRDAAAGGLPQRDALSGGLPPQDPASGSPQRDAAGNGLPQRNTRSGGLPRRDAANKRDPLSDPLPQHDSSNGLSSRDAASGLPQRDPLSGPLPSRDPATGLPQRDPASGLPQRDALSGGLPPRDSANNGVPQRDSLPGGLPSHDPAGNGSPQRDALSGGLPPRDSANNGVPQRDAANGLPSRDAGTGLPPRDALSGGLPQRDSGLPSRDGANNGLPQRDPSANGLPRRDSAPGGLPQRNSGPRHDASNSGLPQRDSSAKGLQESGLPPRHGQSGLPQRDPGATNLPHHQAPPGVALPRRAAAEDDAPRDPGKHSFRSNPQKTASFFQTRLQPAVDTGSSLGTPIFQEMMSAWLQDPNQDRSQAAASFESPGDEGWQAARRASEAQAETRTAAGLPQRNPGGRLVPGGVNGAVDRAPSRDPETIRSSLSRHQQGVRDGRAMRAMNLTGDKGDR